MKRLDSMIAALHKSRKVSIDDFPLLTVLYRQAVEMHEEAHRMLRAGPRSSRGGGHDLRHLATGRQAYADGLARQLIAILWNPDGAFAEHLAGYLMPHGMLAADQQWTGDDAALDRYRLGTKASPIPITWYKPRSAYPDIRLASGEVKTMEQGFSLENGKYSFGVSNDNRPGSFERPGSPLLMKTPHSQNRSKQVELNGVLERAGVEVEMTPSAGNFVPFRKANVDGDHVRDLGFGGKDTIKNYWPLNSVVNRRAFMGYNSEYIINFLDEPGKPGRARRIGGMYQKWFYVKNYLPPTGVTFKPPESNTAEAGRA